MGKVFSVRLLIIRGAMPIGVFSGGVLSELFGVRPLYLLIGLIILTVSAIGLSMPYFKFIDEKYVNEKRSLYREGFHHFRCNGLIVE